MQGFMRLTKGIAKLWNPNQNPTDLERQAFHLLSEAKVNEFIDLLETHPQINIHINHIDSCSLLIVACDVPNKTNSAKKLIRDSQLVNRALVAVKYLLKRGVDIDYRDKNGRTALLVSAHWNNIELAQLLLKSGANPDIGSNKVFYTNPLISSVAKGNLKMITLLLSYGASPEVAVVINEEGLGFRLTPQQIEALKRARNIYRLLRIKKYHDNLPADTTVKALHEFSLQALVQVL